MTENGRETEAKFYIQHLNRIAERLEALEARLVQGRVLEANVRFDLPDARLRSEGRALRLRRDTEVRLTYKGAGKNTQGVLSREEIEFTVEDFDKARQFLEALGYKKFFYYEKYRTTFELNETLIMLDELPYGDFLEIEGNTIEAIHTVSELLNLHWDHAIAASYHALFERIHESLMLSFSDLTFADFAGIRVQADDLGVRAADR